MLLLLLLLLLLLYHSEIIIVYDNINFHLFSETETMKDM